MLLLIARRLGLGLLVALTVMTLAFMLTRRSAHGLATDGCTFCSSEKGCW